MLKEFLTFFNIHFHFFNISNVFLMKGNQKMACQHYTYYETIEEHEHYRVIRKWCSMCGVLLDTREEQKSGIYK